MEQNMQLKELMVKLDLALSQLIDEANVLTGSLEIQNTIKYPSDEEYEEGLDSSNAHTFISALLSKESGLQSSLIDHRFDKVKDLLKNIISRIPNTPPPEVLQLQSQLARIAAAEKIHIEQYEKLSALLQEEKSKRESLEYRAVIANAKLQKVQSQVCQYMEWQSRSLGKSKDDPAPTNGATVNGTAESSAAVQVAELAKQAALAQVKARSEQVEALEAEKLKLSEQLSAAKARVHSLTDDDFAGTELFKILKSRFEEVVNKANDLEKLNSDLREETQRLRAERLAFQNEIEKESRDRGEELEGHIAKNMAEIQRLRQDRDAKFNEKVVLELSQNKHDTELHDLKRLNEAQLSQIQSMQSELERLRLQLGNEPNGTASEEAEQSEEAVRKQLKKYKSLYAVLEQEVESMNKTVSKFRDLAKPQTEQLRRLEQELEGVKQSRAKLQSKSLAQEVTLDSKRQEVQLLRQQMVKTSAVISSINETNTRHTDAAAINERLKEELKAEVAVLAGQTRQLQQEAEESKLVISKCRSEITQLLDQLKAKDSAVSAAEHEARKAETEAASLKVQLQETQKKLQGMVKSGGSSSEELDMLRVS
jgi:E3 ubiquitin-protein ligase BRE1